MPFNLKIILTFSVQKHTIVNTVQFKTLNRKYSFSIQLHPIESNWIQLNPIKSQKKYSLFKIRIWSEISDREKINKPHLNNLITWPLRLIAVNFFFIQDFGPISSIGDTRFMNVNKRLRLSIVKIQYSKYIR